MRKSDLKDKEKVQAAVRQVAEEYLDDPNITSVGVGFKETGGKRTEHLSLQFTVGKKIGLESLAGAPTREIPKQITANGITFKTDVVGTARLRACKTGRPQKTSSNSVSLCVRSAIPTLMTA